MSGSNSISAFTDSLADSTRILLPITMPRYDSTCTCSSSVDSPNGTPFNCEPLMETLRAKLPSNADEAALIIVDVVGDLQSSVSLLRHCRTFQGHVRDHDILYLARASKTDWPTRFLFQSGKKNDAGVTQYYHGSPVINGLVPKTAPSGWMATRVIPHDESAHFTLIHPTQSREGYAKEVSDLIIGKNSCVSFLSEWQASKFSEAGQSSRAQLEEWVRERVNVERPETSEVIALVSDYVTGTSR